MEVREKTVVNSSLINMVVNGMIMIVMLNYNFYAKNEGKIMWNLPSPNLQSPHVLRVGKRIWTDVITSVMTFKKWQTTGRRLARNVEECLAAQP